MRQVRLACCTICALFTLVVGLVSNAEAALKSCEDSPRTVGAFGAMDQPKLAVSVPAQIRSQLLEAKAFRRFQQTKLAPSGEQVIMYDTGDEPEPSPRVAIVVSGIVTKKYDLSNLVEYGQGAIYATSCEFDLVPEQKGFAIAYTLSGDGTGSAFLVLTWSAGDYQLVFHRTVGQGRLVLGSGAVELWDRKFGENRHTESEDFECEWCKHKYMITELEWRNGQYVKTRSRRTRKAYDPAEITGTPLLLKGQVRQVARNRHF